MTDIDRETEDLNATLDELLAIAKGLVCQTIDGIAAPPPPHGDRLVLQYAVALALAARIGPNDGATGLLVATRLWLHQIDRDRDAGDPHAADLRHRLQRFTDTRPETN